MPMSIPACKEFQEFTCDIYISGIVFCGADYINTILHTFEYIYYNHPQ